MRRDLLIVSSVTAVFLFFSEPTAKADILGFAESLSATRKARCATALCWGKDNDFAVEPLVELPVGKTFSVQPATSLGRWIDSHDMSVSFAGGLRLWFLRDIASVSVYFSQPVNLGTSTIHVPGSSYEHPVSNIRRPYPGFALGLLGDSLWIGFDYQALHNGDSMTQRDVNYLPNDIVSSTWSITVGLATITSIRNGIGLGTAPSKTQDSAPKQEREEKLADHASGGHVPASSTSAQPADASTEDSHSSTVPAASEAAPASSGAQLPAPPSSNTSAE